MCDYKKYVIVNKITKGNNQIGGGKKEIYFIRHGETDWNVAARGQGQEADIPLNSTGKTQSITTGKYLNDYRQLDSNFDCIISSPMKRAYSTAKNIAKEISIDKKSIKKLNELIENKAGILSGQTDKDKIKKKFTQQVADAMADITDPIEIYKLDNYVEADIFFTTKIDDYGLESGAELMDRINKVIDYIKETDCKRIIVVSHSSFLDSLLKVIFSINKLPKGDLSKGKNCWICYCTYFNGVFHMISPINTEHFKLYE
jgi:broad specificity phosphatase PhoE